MKECCRIAADARAKDIAQAIEISSKEHEAMRMEHHDWWARGLREAQALARSTIKKPKTREQVLEEALRQLKGWCVSTGPAGANELDYMGNIIDRALEWKGDA